MQKSLQSPAAIRLGYTCQWKSLLCSFHYVSFLVDRGCSHSKNSWPLFGACLEIGVLDDPGRCKSSFHCVVVLSFTWHMDGPFSCDELRRRSASWSSPSWCMSSVDIDGGWSLCRRSPCLTRNDGSRHPCSKGRRSWHRRAAWPFDQGCSEELQFAGRPRPHCPPKWFLELRTTSSPAVERDILERTISEVVCPRFEQSAHFEWCASKEVLQSRSFRSLIPNL